MEEIVNWKRRFQALVLERGNRYYKENRVQNFRYEDEEYRARIIGSASYNVEIKIKNDDLVFARCSCPHAAKGNYCKHMAALMYAIDDKGEEAKRQALERNATKIQPFQISEDAYQYFDLGRILKDKVVWEKQYEDAKKLVESGDIVLENLEVGYHRFVDGVILCAKAEGYVKGRNYNRRMSAIFDREHLIQASCGALGCYGAYSTFYQASSALCVHLLAFFFLIDAYLKKYNPGDSTDLGGRMILNNFRSQYAKNVIADQMDQVMDFKLESVLERDMDGLYVSFKAGVNKLYVLKNIRDFLNQYKNQEVMPFGTKSEIDFAKHRVDEDSQKIFTYIEHIVKEENRRTEYNRMSMHFYYEPHEIKNRIPLYGERLDTFYDIYEGQSIAFTDKSGRKAVKSTITLKEGKPNIRLKIEKDMDQEQIFHGIKVKGSIPDFIMGDGYRYYFKKDAFCRINNETLHEIQPLMEMSEGGKISFSVGRRNLSEFYHQMLPVLKRNLTVEETEKEEIAEYIPPEAEFLFYLDAEEGRILCRPRARYGEEEVSLMEHYKEDCVFQTFRNTSREEEILFYLQQYFPEINVEEEELLTGESDDDVLRFLDTGLDRLMALGEVQVTEKFRSINVRKIPKMKVGVSMESDLMNLSISSDDLTQEELLEILQSYKYKKKYYRLRQGGFVAVDEEDMEMLFQMMETLQVSPKEFVKGSMQIPVYRALYLNKMLEQGENVYLNRDSHFKKLIKEFKTIEDSDYEVPESLADVMRNYQKDGFKWMKTLEQYHFGGILADDMGLGKTLQMISVLLAAKQSGASGTSLIVAPASLVFNWGEEFARFAPELKVQLIVGTQKERAELIRDYQNTDVFVTSYDLLKRDITEYEDIKFSYQVLDEAQYIKNHSTAAAKSVKIIKSSYRYALTGTPIENHLSELWSIFDYLMPGFLYSYDRFRKEIETPIVKHKEEKVSERLRKMVSPFILRRLKEDVLKDLPDKMEEVRYARLEEEQQHLYDSQVVHMKNMIASQSADDFQKNKLQVLAELTKIRQICCDPGLLFEKYQGNSAKRDACMELIESAIEGEHKILLFSQFTTMLELLEQDLKKAGISYYKITGATPKEKRVEMVNIFNQDTTPVFLISLKAGGTGLNLTGADVVIHYDPWWNLAVQNQATDRAHRIGQTKIVSVYKLIVKGTIEEKILKMQESKHQLADEILSGETGSITQMSKDELLELFEGE